MKGRKGESHSKNLPLRNLNSKVWPSSKKNSNKNKDKDSNKEEAKAKFQKASSPSTVDQDKTQAKLKEWALILIPYRKRKIHSWSGTKSGKGRMRSLREAWKINTQKRGSIDQYRHRILPNKSLHKIKGLKFQVRSMKFGVLLLDKRILTVFLKGSTWPIAKFPKFPK